MNHKALVSLAALVLCSAFGYVVHSEEAGSSTGTLIVLNKAEASASLLDLTTGEVLATVQTQEGPHEVAVSPDGQIAVIANYGTRGAPGNTLTIVDVAQAKVKKTIDLGEYGKPHGIVYRRDGEHVLATVEANQAAIEVDVAEGRVTRVFETGEKISHMLDLASDGERMFVSSIGSGTVSVFDLESGATLKTIRTGEGAEGIASSADGTEVWVTNRSADTVTVLDASTLETKADLSCPSFPIRAKATPDGDYFLVSCARSGDLAVFDARTKTEVRRVSMDLSAIATENRLFGDRFGTSSVPVGVLVEPGGQRAWIAHTNADVVVELDLQSWKVSRLLTAGKEPDGLGYSPLAVE